MSPIFFNRRKTLAIIATNSLIYKYLTYNSLFLKDLAEPLPKSLIPKDCTQRGPLHRCAPNRILPSVRSNRSEALFRKVKSRERH